MDIPKEKSESRQRKKKLINDIKELLEFYFSPANLSKDQFMINLLEKSPYIELATFHKFNKIKRLTNETKLIEKAVKKSEVLELSEDGCMVKRCVPIEMKEDELECTIYVENLPPNSSHEWLQKVFSLYGIIDYISLPRFQQTGRPKGFAFIEFHTPLEAQKALEAFGGLASLDGTLNPSELRTIRTFGKINEEELECIENLVESSEIIDEEKPLKRSASEAFSKDLLETESVSKKSKKEKKKDETEPTKKKKKRKRSKKGKEYELDSVYLRVMSKAEWKKLRNQYLNLQKENMALLKQTIQDQNCYSFSQSQRYQTCSEPNIPIKSNKPEFIAEVIVKIVLNEPPQEPREFREGLSNGRSSISYIDISSESKDIYVRFKCSEDSKKFVKEGLWENVQLLEGKEEKEYWEKIFTSWEERKPKRKKKNSQKPVIVRGKEKLIYKALKHKDKESPNTHLLFDD